MAGWHIPLLHDGVQHALISHEARHSDAFWHAAPIGFCARHLLVDVSQYRPP